MKSVMAATSVSSALFPTGEESAFESEAGSHDATFSEIEESDFALHPALRAFAQAHAAMLLQESDVFEASEVEGVASAPHQNVSPEASAKNRKARVKVPEGAVAPLHCSCSPTADIAAQDASRLREITLHARHASSTRCDEIADKTRENPLTKIAAPENAPYEPMREAMPREVAARESAPREGVDEDSLKMWWKRVHTYPLLSSQQEIALAGRIAEGDDNAVREMVECNLRLVASIARKCKKTAGPLSLADLVQEGSIGLIRAAYKFDGAKGYKFSTYASYWIRQAILRAIDEQSRAIRLPVYMLESSSRADRARVALTQELQRVPTDREVARHLQVSTHKVQEMGERIGEPISLDAYVGEDEESTLSDFIEDTNAPSPVDCATRTALREELQRAFECLDKREIEVLSLRYGLGNDCHARTLDEVGALMNLTRERIRQIEKLALKRLKRSAALRETARDYQYESEECAV